MTGDDELNRRFFETLTEQALDKFTLDEAIEFREKFHDNPAAVEFADNVIVRLRVLNEFVDETIGTLRIPEETLQGDTAMTTALDEVAGGGRAVGVGPVTGYRVAVAVAAAAVAVLVVWRRRRGVSVGVGSPPVVGQVVGLDRPVRVYVGSSTPTR